MLADGVDSGVTSCEADGVDSGVGLAAADGVSVWLSVALGVRVGVGFGTVAVAVGRLAPPIVVVLEPSRDRPSPSSIAVIASIVTTKIAAMLTPIATSTFRRRDDPSEAAADTGWRSTAVDSAASCPEVGTR